MKGKVATKPAHPQGPKFGQSKVGRMATKGSGPFKPAPVGSSFKTDMGAKNPPAAGGLQKLHGGGSTVPTWQAARIDGLEGKGQKTFDR